MNIHFTYNKIKKIMKISTVGFLILIVVVALANQSCSSASYSRGDIKM